MNKKLRRITKTAVMPALLGKTLYKLKETDDAEMASSVLRFILPM